MGAGLLASVLQVRPQLTPAALKPSFAKLNPIKGFKRVFGVNALVECAQGDREDGRRRGRRRSSPCGRSCRRWGRWSACRPTRCAGFTGGMVMHIAIRAVAAFLLLAALDFAWQRYRHDKSMRMSKQEVKQEARQSDVAPEIRSQIRRRQLEAARRRMMADVPTADVVVTNPTHYAVALKLRRHAPGARRRRARRRPRGGRDPRDRPRARRPGALEPAARARPLRGRRDRPHDPGRVLRRRRRGARVRLPHLRPPRPRRERG